MAGLTRRLEGLVPTVTVEDPPSRPRPDLLVCEGCDAVYTRRPVAPGQESHCSRCEALIGRGHRLGPDGQLAIAIAALVIFIIGNVAPIVSLDLRGAAVPVTLVESLRATWLANQRLVALLAAATAFVFPLAVILLRIYVLAPLVAGHCAPGFPLAMRLLGWFVRWSMVEVLMLGILIAVVRSAGLATVILGPGIFAFAALTVLLTANQAAGLHRIWHRAAELRA